MRAVVADVVEGRAGQTVRAFELYKGPHWTLLGFETSPEASLVPRSGLHIHRIGEHGDLIDCSHAFKDAYGVKNDDWVLIRPDGYVGAIVSSEHLNDLGGLMGQVGLPRPE